MLIAVHFSNFIFAQKQKVNSAWNYRKYEEYDKAKASIDEASVDESSIGLWKTWYYKGLIYQDIHQQKKEVALNAPNALTTAFEAYKKSLEIDPKHDEVEDVTRKELPQIMQEFSDSAFAQYGRKNYSDAFENFKMRLKVYAVLKQPLNLPTDTNALYNAGLMAESAKQNQDAANFYNQAANLNYKDAFLPLSKIYCKMGDTSKALSTLENAEKNYPGDLNISYGFVNIYTTSHQFEKAIQKLNEALKLAPNNEVLYVVLGGIYENVEQDKQAEEQYTKAYNLNPNNYEVVKSIGINIYNQGVKINRDANKEKDDNKYTALIKKRDEVFTQAIVYLDKANKMKPEDEEVTKVLNIAKSKLNK